jgi:hypothetical protein
MGFVLISYNGDYLYMTHLPYLISTADVPGYVNYGSQSVSKELYDLKTFGASQSFFLTMEIN